MFNSYRFKTFDTDIIIGIFAKTSNKHKFKKLFKKIETDARAFEKKFSKFLPASELSKINQKKTAQIKVSKKMIDLLAEAQKAFKKTNGLFDPTVNISKRTKIPFEELKLNKKTQTITSPPNLQLDFGGIAKGYWVDHIKNFLAEYSDNFWISAGGDMYIKGKKEDKSPWEIGIQNPFDTDSDILTLNIPTKSLAVATSGIAKRGRHIIDPRNNLPVKNSILAVTILCNHTLDADIMAKTILILGIKKGLAKINNMRNYECVIIDNKAKIYISKGLKKFL